jgi:hypothetical protein
MGSFIDKAVGWRQRAVELRTLAARMVTPAARRSLHDMAAAAEHHAENIEETALKFSRATGDYRVGLRRAHGNVGPKSDEG